MRLSEMVRMVGVDVGVGVGGVELTSHSAVHDVAQDAAAGAVEVADVEHDSRLVRKGALFACIPGAHVDGHDFARDAVDAGAVALLAERRIPMPVRVPVLMTDSVRRVLGPVAAAVHGQPSKHLDLIGVTGTNGKTTTVRLIAELLAAAGFGVTEIGTLTGLHTTPEAPELQRRIAAAVDHGDQAVVMEVSSHALAQNRVDGCHFKVAVFTNLGHDHLDYHGSMEAYFQAKARLFEASRTQQALINVTTEPGRRLADAIARQIPVREVDEHLAQIVSVGYRSSRFRWRNELVRLPLGGKFNIANAVMAAETAVVLGLSPRFVAEALATVPQVPGRFELVDGSDDPAVIVDYAHTPEGIEEVLATARTLTKGRLTVIFGAGGDRDRSKRPAMGRAAEVGADRVVLTNDNPRSENPQQIMAEIVRGMCEPPYLAEADRRLAVRHALAEAGFGDVIVIVGKGHENGQDMGHEVIEFNDRVVACEELQRRRRLVMALGR